MAKLNLSNAFMNTNLSGIKVGQYLNDSFITIYEETLSWFRVDPIVNSEPVVTGNKFILNNPTFTSNYATYTSIGSFSGTLDAFGETTSMAINLKNFIATTSDNYQFGNGVVTLTSSINTISSSDANGNTITLTGKYTYNTSADTFTGNMTTLKLTIGSTQLTATKLKITLDDWKEAELSSVAKLLPEFLKGNDVISLSDRLVNTPVFGYAGNDTINGSSADD